MEGANGLWWKEPGGCLRSWQISAQQGSVVSTSLKIKRDHEATFQGMEKGMSMLIESWIDKHGSHCSRQPSQKQPWTPFRSLLSNTGMYGDVSRLFLLFYMDHVEVAIC